MFKSLIATMMLSCTVASGTSQHIETTRNLGAYSGALYGFYCAKDNVDWSRFEDLDDIQYDFSFADPNTSIYVYFQESNDYEDITYAKVESLTLYKHYFSHVDNNGVEVEFAFAQDSVVNSFYYPYGSNSFGIGDYAILYFETPYYVPNEVKVIFETVFSHSANVNCTYYSGWYTFNNVPTFTEFIEFYGNMISGNRSYNYCRISPNSYIVLGFSKYGQSPYYDYVFNSSHSTTEYTGASLNVYMDSILFPNKYYSVLDDMGTFAYIYEPMNYTFGDLIFTVVDSPVYMLSKLFDFRLFDIQFYVAFMGMVTIVLICFVLKKII